MVLNGSVLPSKPPPRGFQLECHGVAGRDDVAPGASTMVLEGSQPFSLSLFTGVRGRGILRTSHVQEFSEFRPTEGCAGLLLLVLWRPRNDGARSEILTTAPIERGKK